MLFMGLIDFIKSFFRCEKGNESTEIVSSHPIEQVLTPQEVSSVSEEIINLKNIKEMKTSELMMKFLKEQGFMPETLDNGNIVFKYQMRTFLYIENDEDASFFQLAMPAIFDVTEDNRDAALDATNFVNKSLKVAKAVVFDDSVWLFTECLLDSSPELDDIVPRFLDILQGAQHEFYKQLQ